MKKMLYLPPISFDNLKQRPQFLAEQLSKKYEVIYVDPTVSMMKYLLKGGEKPGPRSYRVSDTLQVLRLDGRFSLHRSMEAVASGVAVSERRQLRAYLRQTDCVWIGYAPWFDLIEGYDGIVIYDKMDDDIQITKNRLLQRLIARVEPRLIHRADYVFTTAHRFHEQLSAAGKQAVLVPNAVEREAALAEWAPAYQKKAGTRVFGYIGMISHWFDMEAIQTILDADEHNEVILIGPEEIPRLKHERLTYIGRVPKEDVGKWITSFDVCLYPFRKTPVLDTIDPVKAYEYIAANKPVLAVNSAEMNKFSPWITTYEDLSELLAKLDTLSLCPPFHTEEERESFICDNSWERRGKQVLEVLALE